METLETRVRTPALTDRDVLDAAVERAAVAIDELPRGGPALAGGLRLGERRVRVAVDDDIVGVALPLVEALLSAAPPPATVTAARDTAAGWR